MSNVQAATRTRMFVFEVLRPERWCACNTCGTPAELVPDTKERLKTVQ